MYTFIFQASVDYADAPMTISVTVESKTMSNFPYYQQQQRKFNEDRT